MDKMNLPRNLRAKTLPPPLDTFFRRVYNIDIHKYDRRTYGCGGMHENLEGSGRGHADADIRAFARRHVVRVRHSRQLQHNAAHAFPSHEDTVRLWHRRGGKGLEMDVLFHRLQKAEGTAGVFGRHKVQQKARLVRKKRAKIMALFFLFVI